MNRCQFFNQMVMQHCESGYDGYLAVAWKDIRDTIAYNQGKTYTETVSYISHNFSTSQANYPSYGVLAPGGIIYYIPWAERRIYKLDTNTDTITTLDISSIATASRNWGGSVYHYLTGYIYAVPAYVGGILKLDPRTDTCTTIGSLSTSAIQYLGCSIGINGCIYGGPMNATQVLKLDPYTDTISYIGSTYSGEGKWEGGTLAPDGNIYFVPRLSSTVLKVDTTNDTTSTIGSFGSTQYKMTGAIYTPSGKLYLAGANVSSAIYDLSTNTSSNIFSSGSGGVVLGPNGVAYFIKRSASSIGRVDVMTNTALTSLSCSNNYVTGILAPNGCIYAPCTDATNKGILKISINIEGGRNFKESTLLSPFLNKY